MKDIKANAIPTVTFPKTIPIFVVLGETGAYDDYQNWHVKAFTEYRKALKFAATLNRLLKKHALHENHFYKYPEADFDTGFALFQKLKEKALPELLKLDPDIELEISGTSYRVFASELEIS